jgi:hypothetical protein
MRHSEESHMLYRTLLKKISTSAALGAGLFAYTDFTAAHELNLHEKVTESVFAPPVLQLAAAQTDLGQDTAAPRLWTNLGNLTYAVTTTNPEAQKFFDQGLRLAYGFNHAEALRSFRHAQTLDPACAMCFWGEALVLGPNINAPMSADAVKPAMSPLSPPAIPTQPMPIAWLSMPPTARRWPSLPRSIPMIPKFSSLRLRR